MKQEHSIIPLGLQIPKPTLPRPEQEDLARPVTPYLRPVELACDDIPLLELGHGLPLNSDEDEDEDEDDCYSSESYSDEDCSSDWSDDSTETSAAENDEHEHDMTPLVGVGEGTTVSTVETGGSSTDENIGLCASSSQIGAHFCLGFLFCICSQNSHRKLTAAPC